MTLSLSVWQILRVKLKHVSGLVVFALNWQEKCVNKLCYPIYAFFQPWCTVCLECCYPTEEEWTTSWTLLLLALPQASCTNPQVWHASLLSPAGLFQCTVHMYFQLRSGDAGLEQETHQIWLCRVYFSQSGFVTTENLCCCFTKKALLLFSPAWSNPNTGGLFYRVLWKLVLLL